MSTSKFQITFATPALEKRGRNSPWKSTILELHPSSAYIPPVQLSSSNFNPKPPEHWSDNSQSAISTVPTPKLTLTRYLWTGKLYDAWEGQHDLYGRVCLKIVNIDQPPPGRFGYLKARDDPDEEDEPFDILEEALKEERIYMDRLVPVQGSLVPKYYGIYRCESPGPMTFQVFLGMLLEFSGESFGPYCRLTTDEFRTAHHRSTLSSAYQQLHLLGIYHGDTCGRHILMSRNGEDTLVIRLVGFRRSCVVDLTDRGDICDLVGEAAYVRSWIGGQRLENINMLEEVSEYWSKLPPDEVEDLLSYYTPPEKKAVDTGNTQNTGS